MKGVFFRSLAGLTAGLLAWAIIEPSAPQNAYSPEYASWSMRFMLVMTTLIGLAIGAVGGWQKGSRTHFIRETLLAAFFGATGGLLFSDIGETVARVAFPSGQTLVAPLPIMMAWRATIFAFIGLGLGAGIGAAGLTISRTIQGAIGGLLGGIFAGLIFDPVGGILGAVILAARGVREGETGGPSRALMAATLGLSIGLFVGLAERLARSAWIRLQLGKNEGREWAIDRPRFTLGRSELADVPLFGDPGIAPLHAQIVKQGDQYILCDGGTGLPTFLNGFPVGQAPLAHGSFIVLGQTTLQFLLKAGMAPGRAPEARPMAYPLGGYAPQPGQPYPGQQYPGQPGMGQPGAGQPGTAQTQMAQPYPGAQPTIASGGYQQPYPGQSQPAASSPTIAYQPTHASVLRFKLVGMDGGAAGMTFPISGPTEVGRDASGIKISTDMQASRRHAVVSPSASGLTVSDLGSTNGIFVNGAKTTSAELKAGDVLKIGSTNFRVEADA